MDTTNKRSFITTLLLSLIFLGVFTYARAIVSISVIIIIVMYVLYRNKSIRIFKEYPSLWFLLTMGTFFSLAVIYGKYNNDSANLKSLVAFSNPLLLLLFSSAVINFLDGQKKNIEYLLSVVCVLTITLCVVGLAFCGYKYFFYHDYHILINDIYNQESAQFFVAFIFPFISVVLISKAFDSQSKRNSIILFALALMVIFVDVLANRSMLGWLNEFIVFCYYFCKIISNYTRKNNAIVWSRLIVILTAGLIFFLVSFMSAYNISPTIKGKINSTTSSLISLFSSDYSKENKEFLEHTSNGLRSLYYISSIKVMKEYPQVLVLGCPGAGYNMSVIDCTETLISQSEKLKNDNKVVSKIFPHDEFINYTFQCGIVGGLSLMLFLFSIFFFAAKRLEAQYRVYLRILVVMFTTGCLFDFFMSSQLITVSFFALLAILLSTQGKNTDNLEQENA